MRPRPGGAVRRGGESLALGVRLDGGVLRSVPGARQRRFGHIADQGQDLRAQYFAAQLFGEARGLFSSRDFGYLIQTLLIPLAARRHPALSTHPSAARDPEAGGAGFYRGSWVGPQLRLGSAPLPVAATSLTFPGAPALAASIWNISARLRETHSYVAGAFGLKVFKRSSSRLQASSDVGEVTSASQRLGRRC